MVFGRAGSASVREAEGVHARGWLPDASRGRWVTFAAACSCARGRSYAEISRRECEWLACIEDRSIRRPGQDGVARFEEERPFLRRARLPC